MISMHKIPVSEKPLEFLCRRLKEINMPETVVLVPSKRNQHRLTAMGNWELDIQTVAEFTRRANLYYGVLLPKELRNYYLYKATKKLTDEDRAIMASKNNPVQLNSYLAFVERSTALLPFYRELAVEGISTERLKADSQYQDYEQQVMVLAKLWQFYCRTVHEDGFTDEWETFESPRLDPSYLKRYTKYVFLISGYLNNYELIQLGTIGISYDVEIYFNFTDETHYQAERLFRYFGQDIKAVAEDPLLEWVDGRNFSRIPDKPCHLVNVFYNDSFSFIHKSDLEKEGGCTDLRIVTCASSLAQYDFITRQICYAHWNEGVDLSDMAVVLPDPRMGRWFLYSDPYGLYNVAAGRPLESYPFFELITRMLELLTSVSGGMVYLSDMETLLAHPWFYALASEEKACEELVRRMENGKLVMGIEELKSSVYRCFKKIYSLIRPYLVEKITYTQLLEELCRMLLRIRETAPEEEQEALELGVDELEKMQLLYRSIEEEMPPVEILKKVATELGTVKLPSTQGRVAVLGLLESRNMSFKLLFIPDMSSDVFPAEQAKDLFLNSELRLSLGLPTFADRQELQKGYVHQIISRAKSAFITYTKADDTQPSVAVNEILMKARIRLQDDKEEAATLYNPSSYLILPYVSKRHKSLYEEIIREDSILEKMGKFKYSATSLNCYRRCQLRFFYQYIKDLTPPPEAIEEAGSLEIGIILHNIINRLYKEKLNALSDNYLDRMGHLFDLYISQYDYFIHDAVGIFEAEALKSTFPLIVEQERQRLREGAEIQGVEEKLDGEFAGVKLTGRVDRWDKTPAGYDVIDYKYKNLDNVSKNYNFERIDLQLPLYALMLQNQSGNSPEELLWFDLKTCKGFIPAFHTEHMPYFQEDMLRLFQGMMEPGRPFEGSKNSEDCIRCSYTAFCRRCLV